MSARWHAFRFVMCPLSTVLFVVLGSRTAASETAAPCELRLPALFNDNMVLQQGGEIPVWGWASPGSTVTVALAGQTVKARTRSSGRWEARLGALPPGGPYDMTISGGGTITLRNVMIGEVWVCSGQSNMQMAVKGDGLHVLNAEEEIAAANYPGIRLFTVPPTASLAPQEDVASRGWRVCSPNTIAPFSGTAYFFGRELHRQLGVPVGLINASWGGTLAESWTSEDTLKKLPDFRPRVESIRKALPEVDREYRKFQIALARWVGALEGFDAGMNEDTPIWSDPALDDSGWDAIDVPGYWENAGLPDLDGLMWFRKEVTLPESWAGKDLVLRLGAINDMDRTWFNGTFVGSLEEWNQWRVPRQYTVPGSAVKAGRNVIAVRVFDEGGRGGLCGEKADLKLRLAADEGCESIPLAGAWRYRAGADLKNTPPIPQPPDVRRDGPHLPAVLYNGMIDPLIPYRIAGVIWYQGESNANRAHQYRTLFPALIEDWRRHWGQGGFPFIFVQLANFLPSTPQANDPWAQMRPWWPELRDAQLLATSLPATGMAVAIDIGEAEDIHPKNKQEAGRRLALAALHTAYGKEIVYSGPIYKSMAVEGEAIRLHFDCIGGGLAARGDAVLRGFTIAGKDRGFVDADARIEGDAVVVSSPSVHEPKAVRYAWAINPVCNLYNAEGLPASPFRTDDWPGVTEGNR